MSPSHFLHGYLAENESERNEAREVALLQIEADEEVKAPLTEEICG